MTSSDSCADPQLDRQSDEEPTLKKLIMDAVSRAPRASKHNAKATGRRVLFRVVAKVDHKQEHILRFTMSADTPLERLTSAWVLHHSLSPDAVRFMIGCYEVKATDTPLSLAVLSIIPEYLVGVTPAPRGYVEMTDEVVVRALPTKTRAARAQMLRERLVSP